MVYFYATGKYIQKNYIDKIQNLPNYDIMNNTNRVCKGKCIQFKAKKPLTGGRYEAGQFRCQICEIYLTVQGICGRFCRCCNYRVRSKPRNSLYKEKFNEKVQKKQDPWISTDEIGNIKEYTKENEIEDYDDEKKSTPIYEETDKSVKTYYEFKEFLESKMKPQVNYQYVILKELLEYGELHKGEIAESLAYFNNKNTSDEEVIKYYFDVPVYDVLLNHGFVTELDGLIPCPYYTLNVKLENFQKIELIDYLSNAIVQYNKEHSIPENEFPNADNKGNIDWAHSNITKKLKNQKLKNSVNKTRPTSANFWIWSVTPENWKIVESKYVWGSKVPKEKIGSKVQSGDQVVFYVIGTNSFKGIFKFDGNWFDSPTKLWIEDLESNGSLIYRSRINLIPIQLGTVTVSDLYEKMELFIGKAQNIRNMILRGGGYPSNNSTPLLEKDFKIIKQHLAKNTAVFEPKVEETNAKIVKECLKCHKTKVEGFLGTEFDNQIEKLFGYRQFDLNDPKTKKPQSYCRKCRFSKNILVSSEKLDTTHIEPQNNEHVKIYDFEEDVLSIKNCTIESTDIIQKGQILSNDELVKKFGVGNMGGIRYSKKNNVLILCSTFSNHYNDEIDEDAHLIKYTGEKQIGEQVLTGGNYRIANSENIPLLFFKERFQELGARKRGPLDNLYSFIGKVRCTKYYWKEEPDKNGSKRRVVKFILEIQS